MDFFLHFQNSEKKWSPIAKQNLAHYETILDLKVIRGNLGQSLCFLLKKSQSEPQKSHIKQQHPCARTGSSLIIGYQYVSNHDDTNIFMCER